MPHGFFAGLVGAWELDGTVLGRPLEQRVTCERVLGGTWLRVHFHPSTVTPLTDDPYEAVAFLGRDDTADRYVMALFDTFGADGWATGTGDEADGVVEFAFDYPAGRFRTSFARDGDDWLIDQRREDPDTGSWSTFGLKRLRPDG